MKGQLDEEIDQEYDEDPNSILNYLINRLSEQHKTKLGPININNKDEEATSKINTEFEEFEKHLFEKYALPLTPSTSSNLKPKSKQSLPKIPQGETSYFLTKSLYAQHKQINLDEAIGVDDNKLSLIKYDHNDEQQQHSPSSSSSNKMITALSINEIETRKSFRLSSGGASDQDTDHDLNPINNNQLVTLNHHHHQLNEDEDGDEKKFKEEIVLIGEKCDIESLLDNQNNQLFNLILANSSRSKQISNIENDLNRERYNRIKEATSSECVTMYNDVVDDDIQIEIEYQDRDEEKMRQQQHRRVLEKRYESELRDVAKYLVDEITKISVNKLKIDTLNDTLDQKYFTDDILTKQEILNNLIEVASFFCLVPV